MVVVRVNNIVATANLSTSVYLPFVVDKFPFCEYNQKKFAAMTVRFHSPRTTCLVFGSGRIVCTGSSTMMKCHLAIAEVWRMIRETGYASSVVCDFHVQNIVANCSFPKTLNLRELSMQYQTESNYQPGLFPGLVMRFGNTRVVYLVFESGKAVITGSQCIGEVEDKARHLESLLTTGGFLPINNA